MIQILETASHRVRALDGERARVLAYRNPHISAGPRMSHSTNTAQIPQEIQCLVPWGQARYVNKSNIPKIPVIAKPSLNPSHSGKCGYVIRSEITQ
jgi:hypothetical protein